MVVDELSTLFSALADPTRRAILARLADGESTVNELAEPFPMSVQAVSKHLKVLEAAGLVTRGRHAQWRPCRLRPEPLAGATEWLDGYRRFWARSFEQLGEHLAARLTDQPADHPSEKERT
jgi:DNA-binding transcriptional ArsR family regulator